MTPSVIRNVQNSFDRVFAQKEHLAEVFYDELFRLAPEARALFPADLTLQRVKLSDTLMYLVHNLHRAEVIEETIIGLARRHVGYGATEGHFGVVGNALMHALHQVTPDGLTEEEADGWLMVYTLVSDMMVAEMNAAA